MPNFKTFWVDEVFFFKDICGKAFILKGDEEIFDLLYKL